MREVEGRGLVEDFEDRWRQIDAYEKRPELGAPMVFPAHVQRVVNVAMAIYDEVWRVEGPVDEEHINELYEELGIAGASYRETEEQR